MQHPSASHSRPQTSIIFFKKHASSPYNKDLPLIPWNNPNMLFLCSISVQFKINGSSMFYKNNQFSDVDRYIFNYNEEISNLISVKSISFSFCVRLAFLKLFLWKNSRGQHNFQSHFSWQTSDFTIYLEIKPWMIPRRLFRQTGTIFWAAA